MTEAVPTTTNWTPVKLRVEDYLMLDEAGAFDAYGRTELIEGEVVYMNARHRPHARIQSRLHVAIAIALQALGSRLEPLVEGSVSMPPHNVPEPDIALTDEPEGKGLIPLASLALVIEVADSTLRNDLGRKSAIYARERVPEYWVVDVEGRRIIQRWSPIDDGYREQTEVAFGEIVTAATILGLRIATSHL